MRRTRPSWRIRRYLTWRAGLISVISSRKIVPPSASSKKPAFRSCAPVKAPFSCPNSSLSMSVSGIAEQFTATKGPLARSEDRSEPTAFPELPSEQGHLALHGTALHCFVEQHPEPTRVNRLGQIVVGAFPHGRYRRLHGGMPGEEDDHGIWIHFGERLEKSHAVKSGHDKIGNDHGRTELRRFFKGIFAIDGLLDLVAPARQQIGQA